MAIGSARAERGAAVVGTTEPALPLDYYLVAGHYPTADVEGIVVEEFTRQHDFSTAGLDSASWTPEGGWWSSASLSRSMRTDPEMLMRVVPTSRSGAERVYRKLGGAQLPVEEVLRTYFCDHQPFATVPPLRLGPAQPPTGFRERRVYRVLFAKDLQEEQVASLRAVWQTPDGGTPGPVASGFLDEGGDQYAWDLRRVGRGLAWGLDVTVLLRADASPALGSTLYELTNVMRHHGLIPATTERFS